MLILPSCTESVHPCVCTFSQRSEYLLLVPLDNVLQVVGCVYVYGFEETMCFLVIPTLDPWVTWPRPPFTNPTGSLSLPGPQAEAGGLSLAPAIGENLGPLRGLPGPSCSLGLAAEWQLPVTKPTIFSWQCNQCLCPPSPLVGTLRGGAPCIAPPCHHGSQALDLFPHSRS